MAKKRVKMKKFKNEDQERDFWGNIDLSEYFEADDFERVFFPDLKPSTRSISIRIPDHLLFRVKECANKLDIPYQTLMKQYIAGGVASE
jgi:predicted DNA binding CopG/RHH family protein